MAARKYQTRREAAIILGVCGIISGLLSTYVNAPWLELFGAPMLPAVFFGFVVALGIYSWEARHPIPILIAFAGVAVAWWCAWTLAVNLYDENNRMGLLYIGAFSGVVGALITSVALWIASEDFRQPRNVLLALVIGGVAGLLLYFLNSNAVHGLAPLFVVWQAAMAALIGYALAFRPRPS